MAMQAELLEKALRHELKETIAEAEHEKVRCQLQSNQSAIEKIAKWHDEVIRERMLSAEVLPGTRWAAVRYCMAVGHAHLAKNTSLERSISEIFSTKRELVEKWYASEQGIYGISWPYEWDLSSSGKIRHGKAWLMMFRFGSAEVEARLKSELLVNARRYESDANLTLRLLKPEFSENIVGHVMRFLPPYAQHLEQETHQLAKRLESKKPW